MGGGEAPAAGARGRIGKGVRPGRSRPRSAPGRFRPVAGSVRHPFLGSSVLRAPSACGSFPGRSGRSDRARGGVGRASSARRRFAVPRNSITREDQPPGAVFVPGSAHPSPAARAAVGCGVTSRRSFSVRTPFRSDRRGRGAARTPGSGNGRGFPPRASSPRCSCRAAGGRRAAVPPRSGSRRSSSAEPHLPERRGRPLQDSGSGGSDRVRHPSPLLREPCRGKVPGEHRLVPRPHSEWRQRDEHYSSRRTSAYGPPPLPDADHLNPCNDGLESVLDMY